MKSSQIVLDKWQEDIIEAKGNILLCTGRQVGKTTVFAIKAANYLVNNPNHQVIIVSLTEDQAKLIIVMILDYLEKNFKDKIKLGRDKPTQNKIHLKNGAIAIARPVGMTGNSIRGFTGNVLIIDEASRMPELVWAASKPTLLTTAGDIWMCSTPFGKQGYFYKSFLNKNERYKVFHINSETVIKERPLQGSWTQHKKEEGLKLLEDEKADMSELQYGQEYLGLFLDDLRQFFPDTLINKCCVLDKGLSTKKDNYMGCDIARLGGDECAYEILQKTGEICRQVENITKKKQLTTQTEKDILSLNTIWDTCKIGIDAGSGSLGVGMYDRLLENPETKRKVVAMNNRSIAMDRDGKKTQRIFKEDMYDNMLSMMERGELILLKDEDIIASLKSVQWEITEGASSKVRIFGKYTHIAEGLVRAAWLAKKEKVNKLWISYM